MKQSPRVLITAGPTHEAIDAVRYLANRSSGRMGIALAEAATARGWQTTLLLGPTSLSVPNNTKLRILRFQTTADLEHLLHIEWPGHDLLFMAAAVADYRPIKPDSEVKISRTTGSLSVELEPTPDLLAKLSHKKRTDQFTVGFALESEKNLEASARRKLSEKKLDAIVANPLETMDSETISGKVYFRDGQGKSARPQITKSEFADWLLTAITPYIVQYHATRQ